MNRLDNLPDDILKIINRKVQELYIKEKREKKKKNKVENKLLKHKKNIRERFQNIVKKLIQKEQYQVMKISEEYIQGVKNNLYDITSILNHISPLRQNVSLVRLKENFYLFFKK